MENQQPNKGILREKSFQLAIRIVKLCKHLREKKKEFEISSQLFRSDTNPGAMVRESEYAQSGADFINKLEVAQKELNETRYWIELLYATDYLTEGEKISILNDVDEVMRLTTSSIKTRKANLESNKKARN
ncbi:MAG: four helix bundle protein [Phycisphaerae bacterium]|nr:four helix bundle protein [Saprospiraceae bacterium]